jgi:hypothetical protein
MSTRILIRTNRLIVFRVRDESVVRTPHREHAFDENHPHGDLRWFRYFIQLLFPISLPECGKIPRSDERGDVVIMEIGLMCVQGDYL